MQLFISCSLQSHVLFGSEIWKIYYSLIVPTLDVNVELILMTDASSIGWGAQVSITNMIYQLIFYLRYLLLRTKPFRIFCDYKNLVYLFAHDKAIKAGTCQRLQRWIFF